MTNIDFCQKAIDIAKNYKTLYVQGCFGAMLKTTNMDRYINSTSYNQSRRSMIVQATYNPPTFGFDCVCLLKGILWGWNGDQNANYGGAVYQSNGVPDIGENEMINRCTDVSYGFDYDEMWVGEAVWMDGHIGIYIGNKLCVQCTPSWENQVQITACNCKIQGYNTRYWTKHGKLPYVKYVSKSLTKDENTDCGGDQDLTYQQFKLYMNKYIDDLRKQPGSEWSKQDRQWAIQNGIIKGSGLDEYGKPIYAWQDYTNRQQLVTLLHRLQTKNIF